MACSVPASEMEVTLAPGLRGAGRKAKLSRGVWLLGPPGCAAWLLPSPCRDEAGDCILLNTQQCCRGERSGLGVGAEGRS